MMDLNSGCSPPLNTTVQLAEGQRYSYVNLTEEAIELRAPRRHDAPTSCSSMCIPTRSNQKIPFEYIVGAVASGSTGVQVWYVLAKPGSKQQPNRTQHALHKTPVLLCQSAEDAASLVQAIRVASCWWGAEAPPRISAIINPVSGKGKAVQTFSQVVLPILQQAAGMHVTVTHLKHSKHAIDIVKQLDVGSTDMLVSVGGDGTLWECLQGLLDRPDWRKASKLPFIQVPLGSGNGMATSCGILDPVTAAFAICKCKTAPLDAASVLQGSSRHFMVLLFTYGLLSNLDVGTEHLRWMGAARFTVGAIREILAGRGHGCRVAYLPPGVQQAGAAGAAAAAAAAGAAAEGVSTSQATAGAAEGAAAGHTSSGSIPLPVLESLGGMPPAVPSNASALPSGWQLLEAQQVQLFGIANVPWIAPTYNFNPTGSASSGHFNLIYTSRMLSRREGLQLLLASEQGKHLGLDGVECLPFKAMLFEPVQGDSAVMVDGEVVECAPVYLEVHPGLCTVVLAPGWKDTASMSGM